MGADLAQRLSADPALTAIVIAAGERRPGGSLRPPLEDLVGAGLILGGLRGDGLSPEARAAAGIAAVVDRSLLADCASARELVERGFAEDVAVALEPNVSHVVPELEDGWFRPRTPRPPRG